MPDGVVERHSAVRLPRPVRRAERHLRAGGADPLPPAAQRRGRGEGLGARGRRGLARAGRGRRARRRARSRSRRTSSSRASCGREIVTGRRRGEFALMVRNRANAPIDTMVTAVDSANALDVRLREAAVRRRARAAATARPSRPRRRSTHWIGRPMDRRFEISAHGVDGDRRASTRPITGTFRQKPWIPYWVPIVVPAIIAGAVLLYSLIPHKTTVPVAAGTHRGRGQRSLLQKAHLKAADEPAVEEVAEPATSRGGRVVIADARRRARTSRTTPSSPFTIAEPLVPNLLGMTQAQAKMILAAAGSCCSTSPPERKISKKPPARSSRRSRGGTPVAGRARQVSIIVAVGSGLQDGAERRRAGARAAASALITRRGAHDGAADRFRRARIRPR